VAPHRQTRQDQPDRERATEDFKLFAKFHCESEGTMFRFFRKSKSDSKEMRAKAIVDESVRIAGDFGVYLEQNPVGLEIVDEKELPHPKDKILNAIRVLLLVQSDPKIRDALCAAALSLASFQPNIGKERLHPLGFDITSLDMDKISGKQLAAEVLGHGDKKRLYDRCIVAAEHERRQIKEALERANQDYANNQKN
jgi:hypothetical protein